MPEADFINGTAAFQGRLRECTSYEFNVRERATLVRATKTEHQQISARTVVV